MKSSSHYIIIADLIAVLIGYIFSLWLRLEFSIYSMREFTSFFQLLPLILCIYLLSFRLFKVHKSVLSAVSVSDAVAIVSANIFATALITLGKLFLPIFDGIPGSVILISFFDVTLMITAAHFSLRIVHAVRSRFMRKNADNYTLIYGAGSAGRLLVTELMSNDCYEYNIKGFIDDNTKLKGLEVKGYPILGIGEDLSQIVAKYKIYNIIIAMPSICKHERNIIVKRAVNSGVKNVSTMTSVSLTDPSDIKKKIRKIEIKDLLNRKEIEIDCCEIRGQISEKKVLVTGAGGSIGSELVRQIVAYNPSKLVLFDINETGLYNIEQELMINIRRGALSDEIEISAIVGSIRDRERINQLFELEKFDVVFHAAAHKHVPLMESAPAEAIKNNIFGTKNLIDASIENEVGKFINISTDKAVNPTNVMGATKRFIEMMIQSEKCMKSNTKFVAVRFGNVLGSNGSVIPLFQRQIDEGGPVTVTDPNIVRFFMTIPEAVSLVLQAATYASGGEIFVLDMGEPVRINDLAKNMIRLSGYEPNKDIHIQYTGLRPGEKLYEELLMDEEGLRETDNKLIHIAKPVVWKDCDITKYIDEIETSIQLSDPCQVRGALERVVSTYKRHEYDNRITRYS